MKIRVNNHKNVAVQSGTALILLRLNIFIIAHLILSLLFFWDRINFLGAKLLTLVEDVVDVAHPVVDRQVVNFDNILGLLLGFQGIELINLIFR